MIAPVLPPDPLAEARALALEKLAQASALQAEAIGIIFDALSAACDARDLESVNVRRAMELLDVKSPSTINLMCRDGRLVKNSIGRVTAWSIRDFQVGLRPKQGQKKRQRRK